MATVVGSVEITDASGTSIGVAGQAWTVETVPLVLGVLYGLTDFAAVDPAPAPTGRVPDAQWEATDSRNQSVVVKLWPETPYADTLAAQIGPALAEEVTP